MLLIMGLSILTESETTLVLKPSLCFSALKWSEADPKYKWKEKVDLKFFWRVAFKKKF